MSLSDRMAIMRTGKVLQIGNPVEVYEKPLNEYVANFIGTANIFNITKSDNNKYMIDELAIEINPTNFDKKFKKCLIRPEKISIKKIISKNTLNQCTGIVKEVAYLGSYTKYLIESNGFKFYSYMQNSEISEKLKIEWDDLVECSWKSESVYFFNE